MCKNSMTVQQTKPLTGQSTALDMSFVQSIAYISNVRPSPEPGPDLGGPLQLIR
jgi:hypothetical protein